MFSEGVIAALNTRGRPWWHRFIAPFCQQIKGRDSNVEWSGYVFKGKAYMTDWKEFK